MKKQYKHRWIPRLMLLAVLGMAGTGQAQQLNVGLKLTHANYIVGEPVVLQAEIQNGLNHAINLYKTPTPANLSIEVLKHGRLGELEPFNHDGFVKPVTIETGQTVRFNIMLDKWYGLEAEGKYFVKVSLHYGGKTYESIKRGFDVVPGLPLAGGVQMFANNANLQRGFKLVYWHRKQTDQLFLRIKDDPGGRVWDTIPLGSLMKGTPPKIDISPSGEITVIHRATQDAFLRTLLWSLPDVVEIVERNSLLDPDISASQRVNALYGDEIESAQEGRQSWWKFWRKH